MELVTLDLANKLGTVERRSHARLAVSSLIFVKLGDVNGGIAFNISEGGLALSAANGLPDGQIPVLSIQLPDSGDWIGTSAQIQWRSASNKECGVRLVGIDEEARRRIREWIAAEISSAGPIPEPESNSAFLNVELNSAAPALGDTVVPVAKEDKEEKEALGATPAALGATPAAEFAGPSVFPQAKPESESTAVEDTSVAPKEEAEDKVVQDRRIPPAAVSLVNPYCAEAVFDRRTYPRKRISPLGYVQLGNENGGITLNVSEGGLSVTAAHALLADHLPSIRLQFPDNTQWLDVKGEIVWRSESKKEAGVRFVDLSDEARLQLRKWLSPPVPRLALGQQTELIRKREETKLAQKAPSLPKLLNPSATADSSPTDNAPDRAPESPSPLVAEISPDVQSVAVDRPIMESLARRQRALGIIRIRIKSGGWKNGRALFQASMATVAVLGLIGLAPVIREWLSSRPQGTRQRVVIPKPPTTETAEVVPQSPSANVATVPHPQQPDAFQEPNRHPALPNNGANRGVPTITAKGLAHRIQGTQPLSAPKAPKDSVRSLQQSPGPNNDNTESLAAAPSVTNPTLPAGQPPVGIAPPALLRQQEARLAPSLMPVVSAPGNMVNGSENNSIRNGGEAASPLQRTEPAVRINGTVAIATDPYPSIRFAAEPKGKKSRRGTSLQLGQLVLRVEPVYPVEALQKGVQGTVKIHVIVSPDGSIERVVSADGPPLLVPATVRAVQQWRYSQSLLAGRPVEAEDNISVTFGVSTGVKP